MVCIIALFLQSCSNDFKVGADYKEVTAVYGLLSTSDTAHYIIVHKGFFSEKEDNLVMAGNTDSIYYKNLEVKINEYNGSNLVSSNILTKVNLETEGYTKQPGVFASSPNVAYKLKKALSDSYTYELLVKNITTGKVIRGVTNVIASDPVGFKVINPLTPNAVLDFGSSNGGYTFRWEMPNNASVSDVMLDFKYQELNINTGIRTNLTKSIVLIEGVTAPLFNAHATMQEKVLTESFMAAVSGVCGNTVNYIQRFIDTPNLYVVAATPEFKTYVDIANTKVGITADQIKPNYTTLEGENVIGIFSARARRVHINNVYSQKTIDLILASNLNFKGISSQ